MNDRTLKMWVVYDRPTDFPDEIVARLHEVRADGTYGPTPAMLRARLSEEAVENFDEFRGVMLDGIRRCIREHAEWPMHVRLDRSPQDDVKIVETWL